MKTSKPHALMVSLIGASLACNFLARQPSSTPTPTPSFPGPTSDYGDAPDPSFPSYLASQGAHTLDITQFWLGNTQAPSATTEEDAQTVDRDELDDGLERFFVREGNLFVVFRAVKSNAAPDGVTYFNLLADLNGDGKWQGQSEWIAVNREVPLAPGASEQIEVQLPPAGLANIWIRAALTDMPVDTATFPDGWDGRGEFALGEVEDYFFSVPTIPPPTDATIIPPTYTPTPTFTPTPRVITSGPQPTRTPTPTSTPTPTPTREKTIPTLDVRPGEVRIGETVSFTGTGFTPNGKVTKTFVRPDGFTFDFQTVADSSGVVVASLNITKDQPTGLWTAIATDETTGQRARVTFNVVP